MCPWFSSKISHWVFQYFLFDLVVCKKSLPWWFFYAVKTQWAGESKTGQVTLLLAPRPSPLWVQLGGIEGPVPSSQWYCICMTENRGSPSVSGLSRFSKRRLQQWFWMLWNVLCVWFWRIPHYLQKTQQIFHSVTAGLFSMFLPGYV